MQSALSFLKRLFWPRPDDHFYYIKEEMQFDSEAENRKVSYLVSYKKVS